MALLISSIAVDSDVVVVAGAVPGDASVVVFVANVGVDGADDHIGDVSIVVGGVVACVSGAGGDAASVDAGNGGVATGVGGGGDADYGGDATFAGSSGGAGSPSSSSVFPSLVSLALSFNLF
jgi:hypothetical protein